jgi:hypothetical protein
MPTMRAPLAPGAAIGVSVEIFDAFGAWRSRTRATLRLAPWLPIENRVVASASPGGEPAVPRSLRCLAAPASRPRVAYVVLAVTEIATLRAQLAGPQLG